MQIVKNFIYGRSLNGDFNPASLEDQINEYLEFHPGYSVATMSMLNGTAYKETLVVFNVREERQEKDIKRTNKQDINSVSTKDYKNHGKDTLTANSNSKT